MKRAMPWVVWGLCLCLAGAGSAHAAPQALHAQELLALRDDIFARMQTLPVENDPEETYDPDYAETWLYAYGFGLATLSSPLEEGGEDALLEVEILSDEIACPRGIRVGDTLEQVLAAYPNENEALSGDAQYAVLYEAQDGDAWLWGWVLRRNQSIDAVEYTASSPVEGLQGFRQSVSILYVIEDGRVASFRMAGFGQLLFDEESEADRNAIRQIAARTEYTPGARGELQPLSPDDLVFSGLSFQDMTPEALIEAFGEPAGDERTAQPDVRTITYPGVLAEYTLSDEAWSLSAVLVSGQGIAGPRGVQLGDTLQSVLERFGEGDAEDSLVYLCYDEAGNGYAVMFSFSQNVLTEYLLYRI